jgi:hypothetical protein
MASASWKQQMGLAAGFEVEEIPEQDIHERAAFLLPASALAL